MFGCCLVVPSFEVGSTEVSFFKNMGRFLSATLDRGQCRPEVNFLGILGMDGIERGIFDPPSLTYFSI